MSRNKSVDYTQYVHEYEDSKGVTRWAVAWWDAENAQYRCPMDARERELTGCFAYIAKTPAGIGGYTDRKKALRRARYLFGPREDEE